MLGSCSRDLLQELFGVLRIVGQRRGARQPGPELCPLVFRKAIGVLRQLPHPLDELGIFNLGISTLHEKLRLQQPLLNRIAQGVPRLLQQALGLGPILLAFRHIDEGLPEVGPLGRLDQGLLPQRSRLRHAVLREEKLPANKGQRKRIGRGLLGGTEQLFHPGPIALGGRLPGRLVDEQAGQRDHPRRIKLLLSIQLAKLPQRLLRVAGGQQCLGQGQPGGGQAGIGFQGPAEGIDLLIDASHAAVAQPDRHIDQLSQIDPFRREHGPATLLEACTGLPPMSLGHRHPRIEVPDQRPVRESSSCNDS